MIGIKVVWPGSSALVIRTKKTGEVCVLAFFQGNGKKFCLMNLILIGGFLKYSADYAQEEFCALRDFLGAGGGARAPEAPPAAT